MKKENVAILGASDKKERYSYKAFKLLCEYGHRVFLIHPSLKAIDGEPCYPSLDFIKEKIDTLTLYVNPDISNSLTESILKLKPSRVIFNPGTESEHLEKNLQAHGISYELACTLVLLKTGQY